MKTTKAITKQSEPAQENPNQSEVAQRILKAADSLMARIGVQNLSTHKIAKEAGVSVGTIYLYFKDKDDLLNQLVIYLFEQFHAYINRQFDPSQPLFEQYKQLWQLKWQIMLDNPNVVKNMHQYEAIPQFQSVMIGCFSSETTAWNRFVKQGQAEKVIAPLPPLVLWAISIGAAWELMYQQAVLGKPYAETVLDDVIMHTWKAITL